MNFASRSETILDKSAVSYLYSHDYVIRCYHGDTSIASRRTGYEKEEEQKLHWFMETDVNFIM